MPSRNAKVICVNSEEDSLKMVESVITEESCERKRPPMEIVWGNLIWFGSLHLAALYGLSLLPWAHPYTWIWTVLVYEMGILGITAGVHRLWTHRAYKAKLPLRILLAFFNSIAFQNDIIEWARDHRVHHKYSETEADPHNAKRGFFFSHCGWLLVRKLPDVKAKGKLLDLSDLYADPVCMIQRRLYLPSVALMCFIFPMVVPWYFWGESLWTSYFVCSMLRYVTALHFTWFVNSWAHMFGNKPYDKLINPSEDGVVAFLTLGEGYHNYHHTFPQDYSTSEYGWRVNITTMFIDFMSMIGQAYDCKKMSNELISRRKQRTGDGSTGFGWIQQHSTSDKKE